MKTTHLWHSLPSLLLGATLVACAASKYSGSPVAAPSAPPPLTREDTLLVTVTAKVEAIDHASREVTLRGPLGNVVTFVVDERVKRLAEVKVGDEVTADYYVSLAGELREPTAEERAAPLTVLDASARAPEGTMPAGGGLRAFKVVATVEGLDRPTRSVTLRGPLGNFLTVRARDVNNFQRLHLGDTIVVTYTEALAVSLDKVESSGG